MCLGLTFLRNGICLGFLKICSTTVLVQLEVSKGIRCFLNLSFAKLQYSKTRVFPFITPSLFGNICSEFIYEGISIISLTEKSITSETYLFFCQQKDPFDFNDNKLIQMGAIRSQPDTKINIKAEKFDDLNYVQASVCGWQHIMQDYTGYAKINQKFKVFFVIDGHGGPDLAQIAIQQIPEILRSSEALKQQQYKTALENLFQTLDAQLKKQNQRISLIRQKYGLAPLTEKYPTSGFSMVVALIGENEIIIGNVGECKAYVCYTATPSKAVLISGNHSETNNDDDTRVKNAGGYFINGRTNGIFPFTRSIGDYALKQNTFLPKNQQILVSTPSIFSLRKQDIKFFVLGSSGLWQNTNFVLKYLTEDELELDDLKEKTQKLLLQELICKNPKQSQTGLKNIGVVVIDLKN